MLHAHSDVSQDNVNDVHHLGLEHWQFADLH